MKTINEWSFVNICNVKASTGKQKLTLSITSGDFHPDSHIGVAMGWAKGAMPTPKFLENIVNLCFEKRFSKQNSVIRLKSNTLAPPNFLAPSKFLGWLRHWTHTNHNLG